MNVPFCIGIIKPSKNVPFLYFKYLIMFQIFSVAPKGKKVMPLLMVRMSSKRRTQTIELKSIFVYPLIHIYKGIIIYFTSEELFINMKNLGRNSRDSFVLYGLCLKYNSWSLATLPNTVSAATH